MLEIIQGEIATLTANLGRPIAEGAEVFVSVFDRQGLILVSPVLAGLVNHTYGDVTVTFGWETTVLFPVGVIRLRVDVIGERAARWVFPVEVHYQDGHRSPESINRRAVAVVWDKRGSWALYQWQDDPVPIWVRAIVRRGVEVLGDYGQVVDRRTQISFQTAQIETVRRGDRVQADGEAWIVDQVIDNDGMTLTVAVRAAPDGG